MKSSKPHHRIRRHAIELSLPHRNQAEQYLARLRNLVEKQWLPQLEAMLDGLGLGDVDIQIDRLELDLGDLPISDWERQLPLKLEEKLRKAVHEALAGTQSATKGATTQGQEQNALGIMRFYLQQGYLPWWGKAWTGRVQAALRECMQQSPEAVLPLLVEPPAAERLYAALGEGALDIALEAAIPRGKAAWEAWSRIIEKLAQTLGFSPASRAGRRAQAVHVLQALAESSHSPDPQKIAAMLAAMTETAYGREQGQRLVAEIIQGLNQLEENEASPSAPPARNEAEKQYSKLLKALPKALIPKWDKNPPAKPARHHKPAFFSGADPIYIDNAGLILLHPFLPALFDDLGLLENDVFVDKASASFAAVLLHHLVWGEAPQDESPLVLNKLLCGLEISDPVDISIQADPIHLAALDELLDALRGHWKEVQAASNDDIRQTFFQREGRLLTKDDGFELLVERKTVDLIVDRLQWTFGIIRLPWLPKLMFVEW